MRRSEKINIWIFRIAAVLLCLTVLSVWGTSGLYARYSTSTSGSDGARVALWGSSESIQLDSQQLPKQPGQSCTYKLTVSNQRSTGEISEVTQKYHIEVVTAGNLPLDFTLQMDGNEIGKFTETANHKVWTVSEDNMVFQAGVARESKYTMTVTWPAGQVSAALANVPDYIQVNVCSEQVD